jgi:hypothetical protein
MKKDAVDLVLPVLTGDLIFILFIIQSMRLLADDGVISFVLPKNFLNCLYYDKTRKCIAVQILYIVDLRERQVYRETADTIITDNSKKNGSTPVDIDNSAFVETQTPTRYLLYQKRTKG